MVSRRPNTCRLGDGPGGQHGSRGVSVMAPVTGGVVVAVAVPFGSILPLAGKFQEDKWSPTRCALGYSSEI
jgi:hypothetical protein